jgi:ribosomal-protein-alanine N-acetyltransferase
MNAERTIAVRPLAEDDYDLVASWLSDPSINRWLASEWRGRGVTARHVAALVASPRNQVFVALVSGRSVGVVALGLRDPIDRTANLWYLLGDKAYAGRGVMTEAVRQVTRAALKGGDLGSVQASVMDDNISSARVLEKAGFRAAGRFRRAFFREERFHDRLMYDLTPEDM